MKITNITKNTLLAENAAVAETPFKRMKGLLGRRDFLSGEALIIRPANSIHTFFMRFPIDILFVDGKNKIVGIENSLAPWRLARIYWRAKFVVELPSGAASESKTSVGDQLNLVGDASHPPNPLF